MTIKTQDFDVEASAEFAAEVCPLLSLQKAAYEFSSRALARVEPVGDSKFLVTLVCPSGGADQILGAFKARVADLALQEKINEQTRTIRDALVTAAIWQSLPHKVP